MNSLVRLVGLYGFLATSLLANYFLPTTASAQTTTGQKHNLSNSPSLKELSRMDRKGRQAYNNGDFAVALSTWKSGLQMAQTMKADSWIALFLTDIGTAYYSFGLPDEALRYHEQALKIRVQRSNKQDIAISLVNIGMAYYSLGQCEQALDFYQRTMNYRGNIDNQMIIAATLTNIGFVYSSLGQYEKALDFCQQALKIMEKWGNKPDFARSFENIGFIYSTLGRLDKALGIYQQALKIKEKWSNKQEIAGSYESISLIYKRLDQYDKALDFCQRALKIREKFDNQQKIASSLDNIGIIYNDLNQYDKALEFCQQALKIREKWGNLQEVAGSFENVGLIYISLKQYDKALDFCQQALKIREQHDNQQEVAGSYENMGRIYDRLGRFDDAVNNYAHAIQKLEGLGSQVSDSVGLGNSPDKLYGLYARYALALHHLKLSSKALLTLEHGKGLRLTRFIQQNQHPLSAVLGEKDGLLWQNNNRQHNVLNEQILKLEETRSKVQDTPLANTLSKHIQALRYQQLQSDSAHTALFRRLCKDHPEFDHLFFPQSLEGDEFQKQLFANGEKDTLFLEYAVVDKKNTLLFALAQDHQLVPLELSIGIKELEEQVAAWRKTILNQSDDEPVKAMALYKTLLQPLVTLGKIDMSHYRSLVIVSDGPLLDLPFAALLSPTKQRLAQTYALSNPFFFKMLHQSPEPHPVHYTLLAAASPLGPSPLPGALQQAENIMQMFTPALLLKEEQATREAVLKVMGDCQLLHFGVHGRANSYNGFYSDLLLAGKDESEQRLTAAEVTEHRVSAQLTVLGACETMQGQKRGGEGLLGMAWAFRAAGCPSVMATQWKIDDDASANLLEVFYRELKKPGMRKDVALQKAMQAVMQTPAWNSPRYWAAFQILGTTTLLQLTFKSDLQK